MIKANLVKVSDAKLEGL